MKSQLLLAELDRLSEAPGGIDRLRQFTLDLAVRGRLVKQALDDPPASELLDAIRDEKAARLLKAGKLVKQQLNLGGAPVKPPFEIPASWEWVRLTDVILKLTDGTHHSPSNWPSGDYMYITAKNIKSGGVNLDDVTYVSASVHKEIYSRCDPEQGDILYVKDGATTGVVTINQLGEPFSMLSSVALLKVSNCVYNRLLLTFLRSPFFYNQMRGYMKGAALPRVTLKRMAPALLPLPPAREQHRIVAKVEEIMAVYADLEQSLQARQNIKRRLLDSALHEILSNGSAM